MVYIRRYDGGEHRRYAHHRRECTLTLNDNELVLPYADVSPLATVRAYLRTGYNAGAWNGKAIASTTGHTNSATGLAAAEASDLELTSFDGQSLSGDAVLVKCTYYGDSTLDGKVDPGNDFALFLQGYLAATNASSWVFGDYNYDGVVNLADFQLFIDGYKQQGAALGSLDEFIVATPVLSGSQKAELLSAVPEPSSAVMIIGSACLFAANRRRRR